MNQNSSGKSALPVLISVFFFWGFLAASNGIFIPFCKSHFSLSQLESQLIDTSFYGAYFIGSLLLYLFSAGSGVDILNKIGYKKGIIWGLSISVVGALIMIVAARSGSFGFILGAFFVIALGFSLQQTAAQPFAIALGDPSTGSHRLNLGGGVNSFGTTIGPLIVSYVLFGSIKAEEVNASINSAGIGSIENLYLILSGVFVLVILIFAFSKMPVVTTNEKFEKTPKATRSLLIITGSIIAVILLGYFSGLDRLLLLSVALIGVIGTLLFSYISARKESEGSLDKSSSNQSKEIHGWGAMKYPQLVLGMIAIFVYVGVEVTIQSNMGALLKTPDFGSFDESHISIFISLFWGSLMIGRWTGAITVFDFSKSVKRIMTIVVPLIAFGVVLLVNHLKGNEISQLYIYIVFVAVLILSFFMSGEKPAKTLTLFSSLAIIAMLIGLITVGKVSTFAFISGGLFCSVLWPCIFSLSIAGLGKYASQGSAFLIMMILGGAIIPPLQGGIADSVVGIHMSYIVTIICFAYLAFFGWKVKQVLKRQGIDYDANISEKELLESPRSSQAGVLQSEI